MNTFKVISEYTGEEGHDFEAHDAEDAAEQYGEWIDSYTADYCIVGGEEETVTVECENGKRQKFVVSGYSRAVYSARELP